MLKMILAGKKLTGQLLVTGVLAATVLTAVPEPAGAAQPAPAGRVRLVLTGEEAGPEEKAARIAEIEESLTALQAEAGSRGNAAVQATGEHQLLNADLEANAAELAVLSEQKSNAAGTAETLSRQMGLLAAQTYKTGGLDSGLLMLLDADAAFGAVERLTTLAAVSDRTGNLRDQAAAAVEVLQSLEDREAAALKVREETAAQADEAAAAARALAAEADTAVRVQQERGEALLSRLADLRETSVQAETERLRSQQQEAAYADQARAARDAALSGSAGDAGSTGDSGNTGRPAAGGSPEQSNPKQSSPEQSSPEQSSGTAPALPGQAGKPGTAVPGSGGVINPIPAPQQPKPTPVTPAPPATAVPNPEPAPEPVPVPQPVDNPAAAQAYASAKLAGGGAGPEQFACLVSLWNRESGWRTSALNPHSGAYGIPQSYPGDKMATAGADWRTSYRTQVDWGLGYIKGRYKTPCAAWAHSQQIGWY